MPAIPPAWKMCSAFTVRTDWLFYWLQTSWGGSVCESFTLVLETNGLRGIWLRSLVRSLQLHIKVDMGILMSLMVAGNSHSDVCLAVKICRITVDIIQVCFLSSCLMPLVSKTKVNLPKTLPLQLICNQGSHSVVKTSNQLLQCSTPLSLVYIMEPHKSIHVYFKE